MHLGGAQHGMGPGRSHAEVSHTPHGLMGIHMTPHGHPMDTPWTPHGHPMVHDTPCNDTPRAAGPMEWAARRRVHMHMTPLRPLKYM